MFGGLFRSTQPTRLSDAAAKLFDDQPAAPDAEWWTWFWTCHATVEEVWQCLPTSALRNLRQTNPAKLSGLIQKLVDAVCQYAEPGGCTTDTQRLELLTCIRVLTRLVPFMFEDVSDEWQAFQQRVFWAPRHDVHARATPIAQDTATSKGTSTDDLDVEFALSLALITNSSERVRSALARALTADLEDAHRTTGPHSRNTYATPPAASPAWSASPYPRRATLGGRLVGAMLDISFLKDFTVTQDPDQPLGCLWAGGVESASAPGVTRVVESNRQEVVSLLLALVSSSLYSPLKECEATHNMFLVHLTTCEHMRVGALACSLLNTALTYDPVGYGIPYSHFFHDDHAQRLAANCLQLLLVLLDYTGPPGAPPVQPDHVHPNLFIRRLRAMTLDDMAFVLGHLTQLLEQPLQSGYLPRSHPALAFSTELLLLLWRLFDECPQFVSYVCGGSWCLDLVEPVLHCALQSRSDIVELGGVHVATYVLLILSGERNFAVRLNRAFPKAVRIDIPAISNPTYCDLIILGLHRIITAGHSTLAVIHDCMLTVIDNISPYLKTINKLSAAKLLSLFEAFSNPRYLYAAPHNPNVLIYLLETFNNLIQYQLQGSTQLVYAILRHRIVFERLASLAASVGTGYTSDNSAAPSPSPGPAIDHTVQPEAGLPVAPLSLLRASSRESTQSASSTSSSTRGVIRPGPVPPEWTPTQDWIRLWAVHLPLATIMTLLQVLVPQIDALVATRGVANESEMTEFLESSTLVGLLPVPHPITIRKYHSTKQSGAWLTAFMWGKIFLKHTQPPIWLNTHVRLFEVRFGKAV